MRFRLTTPDSIAKRFLTDDSGQDFIEYALLGAFVGIVGILAWNSIGPGIGTAYSGWDSGVRALSSCTPDPGGAGC